MAKFIFVMGGVVSSLGKGIACSSIGLLLKSMGYNVGIIKLDPYLNVDPGTMSPFQHGEVFVTEDGAETDLDLGHYERFIDKNMGRHSNTTSGQIYESVLRKERMGKYLGKTVQVIPHVTNEIIATIRRIEADNDIVLCEVGGTIGDIESLPFLEAVRQIRLDVGYEDSMNVFLTYVPYVRAAGEIKTKPTQHSTYKLREIGIQPDVLLCRSEKPFGDDIRAKIALFTNVKKHKVINAFDVKSIYEVPMVFREAGLHEIICQHLRLDQRELDLADWDEFVQRNKSSENPVTIAVCGKYVEHQDAYKSVVEALIHAAAHHSSKLNIRWVDSEKIWKEADISEALAGVDGILIPGGFGVRGIEGKIAIVKYARTNAIPYLGICLGMQVAVIEYAKNVCRLEGAYSLEFDEICAHPVINLMEDQRYEEMVGGTMRLGAYPCALREGSLARDIYGEPEIAERHRHRYEFNNEYRQVIEKHGMRISGTTPDDLLVEITELPGHPFFIGVQFHPEFRSRPNRPHPIFCSFVGAAIAHTTHTAKPEAKA
ncbi:MAG: CTP synthase [Candidatus Cloacimonetes bacterium]|nr:CTP synthase [Candidatus Cloacimonadota bacterium]